MLTHPFMQVDAFTSRPLGGNPCAIVFDTDDMTADTMQAIAREMKRPLCAVLRWLILACVISLRPRRSPWPATLLSLPPLPW